MQGPGQRDRKCGEIRISGPHHAHDEEDPGGEGEDEEPDRRTDGAQGEHTEALGQDRRTDEGTPRTCMRMHEGG